MDKAELGGGLLTATFLVAIAGGAVFGGLLVDRFSVLAAPTYCVSAATLGLVLIARRLVATRRNRNAEPVRCAS